MVASLRLDPSREITQNRTPNVRSPVRLPHMSPENLSEDAVFNSAFNRAWSNFKDDDAAQVIAFAVADSFTATWEKKMAGQSQKSGGYLPKQNPASYLDTLITLENQARKDILIARHIKGKQPLGRSDFWLWFIEDVLHYAKTHRSPYMAVAMLMVLCDFHSFKVFALYWYLAQTKNIRDDSTFRRCKLDYIMPEMGVRYGPFTNAQRFEKNEERYVKEADTKRYLEMFRHWLEQLTPLYPQCFLPNSFDPYRMEKDYILCNVSDYPDEDERKRKHIMQCPKCLTQFLGAAGFVDWIQSFVPPEITLRGPDSGDEDDPSNRTKPRNLAPQQLALMKKMLGRRNIRRQRLSFKSLFVAVDNGGFQKIRPNKIIKIPLKDGNSLIRVSGKDWRGKLPLDTHLISWDEDLLDEQAIRYTTVLDNDRELQFSVEYQPDMLNATATIEYVVTPERSRERALAPASIWPRVIGTSAAGLAIVGVAALLLISSRSKIRTDRPPNNSALATIKTTMSPEPNSSPATPVAPATSPVKVAKESYPTMTVGTETPRNKSGAVRSQRRQFERERYVNESRLRGDGSKLKQEGLAKAKSQPRRFFEILGNTGRVVGSSLSKGGNKAKKGIESGLKAIGNLIPASPYTPLSNTGVPNAGAGTQLSSASPYPPPSTAPAVTTLTGIVTDLDDRPVPFAIILFRARRPNASSSPTISSGQVAVVCNSEGRFAVRYTTGEVYDLVTEQDGFALASNMGVKVSRETASAPRVHIKLQSEKVPEDYLIDRGRHHRHAGQVVDSF